MRFHKKQVVIIILSIFLLICLIYSPILLNQINYSLAVQNMEMGNLDKALDWFQKDKEKYSEEINECTYLSAKQFFEKGEFSEAYDIFLSLSNYRDSEDLKLESLYRTGIDNFEEQNFSMAAEIFESLDDYKDSVELRKECIYQEGLMLYNNGDYFEAANKLTEKGMATYEDAAFLLERIITEENDFFRERGKEEFLNENFDLSLIYFDYARRFGNVLPTEDYEIYRNCKFINKIQGEYTSPVNDKTVSIKGFCFDENGEKHKLEVFERKLENLYPLNLVETVAIIDGDEDHFLKFIDEGKLWQIKGNINQEWSVWVTEKRLAEELEFAEQKEMENMKKEPKLGMTEEEVLNSTWGKPKKRNKTTATWGTSEQWVYSNNRYIYFDNGIVTAISESE